MHRIQLGEEKTNCLNLNSIQNPWNMKRVFLVISLVTLVNIIRAQTFYQSLDTTSYYEFHVNYWFNMHNFLWNEAFLQVNEDSTLLDADITTKDLKSIQQAIGYYKSNLVEKDLRTDDYMKSFKEWITALEELPSSTPGQFSEHMRQLKLIDPTYQKVLWPGQIKLIQKTLSENLPLVIATEEGYWDRITQVTRHYIREKARVDVVYMAKATKWNLRNRPYTSIFPTRVVMNVVGENDVKGNWVELLYHESAHSLILTNTHFVAGTINDVAQVHDLKIPRQLWHAYLFYFTGAISQELLKAQGIEYKRTYMERNEVFSSYIPTLKTYMKPYLDGQITLSEATKEVIMALSK